MAKSLRCVAALCAIVLLQCAASDAAARFGALFITSLPSGADVWVDGSYIGRTPLLIDGLQFGKHSVTVTKAGWKVAELDQVVTAGATASATVQLQPAMQQVGGEGTIALHGVSTDARVAIDGGNSQPVRGEYRVGAGSHNLTVREANAKYERTIVVYAGQTTHVLFRPAASDERSAVVAPVDGYLPASACKISGSRLVIRWSGHVVVGHLGDARFSVDHRDVVYDAPAGLVRGRLYLPLDLILAIAGKGK